MSLPNVEKIIADFLDDAGVANVFRGVEKGPTEFIPYDSVFVYHWNNNRPQSFLSGGKGPQHHTVDVQIMVRSHPTDEETSRDTVYTVYDEIRDTSPPGVNYVKVAGGPLRLGGDDDDVYRWTINLEVNFIA